MFFYSSLSIEQSREQIRLEISKLARFYGGASQIEYLRQMPISELYELIEDANEIIRLEKAEMQRAKK